MSCTRPHREGSRRFEIQRTRPGRQRPGRAPLRDPLPGPQSPGIHPIAGSGTALPCEPGSGRMDPGRDVPRYAPQRAAALVRAHSAARSSAARSKAPSPASRSRAAHRRSPIASQPKPPLCGPAGWTPPRQSSVSLEAGRAWLSRARIRASSNEGPPRTSRASRALRARLGSTVDPASDFRTHLRARRVAAGHPSGARTAVQRPAATV